MKVGVFGSLMMLVAGAISFSAFADDRNFCVGESVVYTQSGTHYDAVIQELYNDGTAQLSFPNGEFSVSQVSTSALSVHLDHEHGFWINEAVVYSQSGTYYDAIIQKLYVDGVAQVSFPNGEFSVSQVSLDKISIHLDSEGGFNVGDSLIYTQSGSHYHATVQKLYTDGIAQVSFPNGEFSVSQVKLSTLSRARNYEGGFGVSDAVVYTQSGVHYNAKIDELYEDGTALVEFPNGEFSVSTVSLSTLSYAESCTEICRH